MALTPEEILALQAQAQEQAGTPEVNVPTTANTEVITIKEGEIIEPKVDEYKTHEQLREEAEKLAIENEREIYVTSLEAKLVEDYTLTPEQRANIEAEIKELRKDTVEEVPEVVETPEQEIARLKKELEEAKKAKADEVDPLAEVEKQAKDKGIDVPELYKEYVENGELSPESLKSLLDAGFNQVAIDAYIDTKIAQAEKHTETLIKETVGTREAYDAMAEWMRTNLSADEIKAYDVGVNSNHAKIYIENMYNKYNKATAKPLVIRNQGNITQTPSTVGFKSLNEQALAIADARYGNDTKYTAEVRRKIQLSTF